MAPQAGFEPATDRLTADSSTTELLRNNACLAMSYSRRGNSPTTIGAEELNFRVRHGNGCDLFAIITRQFSDKDHYTMYLKKCKCIFREIILSKLDNGQTIHKHLG